MPPPPPPPSPPFSGDQVAAEPDRRSSTPSESNRTPPQLIEDLISEILVRVPPDDPAYLVRASLACGPWRRLLTDPGFLHRYRALHRTPPMLGFLCNVPGPAARFVSTSSFRPAAPDRHDWHVIAVGHGRVLVQTITDKRLVIWDPVTDQQWWLPPPVPVLMDCFNAAVLCASAFGGCDHLDCHGGPFHVAFVGVNKVGVTFARLYSSEAGEWSEPIWIEEGAFVDRQPGVLLGNTVYYTCNPIDMSGILEYDMGKGKLSLIELPLLHRKQVGTILMTTEAGTLGFAGIHESRLYLWSRVVDPHGVVAWARHKVIELETLLLTHGPKITPHVLGFAEGVGIIFVRLNSGVFSIELKSGNAQKVPFPGRIHQLYPGQTKKLFPYMSFYTPDRCRRKISTTHSEEAMTHPLT